MRKTNHAGKKMLSLFLTLMLLFGMFPAAAIEVRAENNQDVIVLEDVEDPIVVEETVEPDENPEPEELVSEPENDNIQNYLTTIDENINHGLSYLNSRPCNAYGNEWTIFTILRCGGTISEENKTAYLNNLKDDLDADGQLSSNNQGQPTDYARVILTLGMLGEDPADFRGYNLVETLYNWNNLNNLTINQISWTLLALDSKQYDIPEDAKWSRETLINLLVSKQNEDGGFASWGSTSDVDMTAMVLQTLVPYNDASHAAVQPVFEGGIRYLQSQINEDAGFESWGNENACSTAQVLILLPMLGMDPAASNGFVKAQKNMITNLEGYRDETGGGFFWQKGSPYSKDGSTYQVVLALESCRRFASNENSVYDLTESDKKEEVKALLQEKINEVQNKADTIMEGDEPGQYAEGTKQELLKAVADAQEVCDNPESTETDYDQAMQALKEAEQLADSKKNVASAEITIAAVIDTKGKKPDLILNQPVRADEAEKAGYTKPEASKDKVTVLDALVVLHKEMFGEEDFGKNPTDYLEINASGWITTLFGLETSYVGFYVNHESPSLTCDQCELKTQDTVCAFLYGDTTQYSDQYLFIEKTQEQIEVGESLSLIVKSAGYMTTQAEPGCEVTLTDPDGNQQQAITDENGVVLFQVQKAGIYTAEITNNPFTYSVTSGPVKITVEEKKEEPSDPSTPVLSSESRLSALVLSAGTLSPAFSANTKNYTAIVENATDKLAVKTKAADGATVTVNGKAASKKVDLKVGYNTIKIQVKAEDGKATSTYTVKVTRAVPKNYKITISGKKYQVTNALSKKGTVAITGLSSKKAETLSVPNTVKIYGITYKVTSVGKNAFRELSKLKSAKVGDNVTTIGYGAFYKCPALKSVTLGKNVKSIGNHAFCRDVKLRTLTLNGTALTKVGEHVLYKAANLTIKAPSSKVKTYKKLFTNKGTKNFKVVKK
ncbi:MAG: leucine-rich repeat protein [Lachnospiraceae bacterium]